ncbi:MAG: hypothetical protein K2O53_01745 [Bacteroidales bacterium]|nr:hypothetical protein [Bacteroidales bacterium]
MYSVHYPCSRYEAILDILSSSKTNSSKTSSLPLADFWHPERNGNLKDILFQKIGIKLNPQKTEYCFEYQTPAYENGESGKTLRYSKPSMTDLMILLNDKEGTRITIEAKYTEYEKNEYDPLETWYKDKPLHKTKILKCWLRYINGYGKISSVEELEELLSSNNNLKFPYQFLHRTASACFKCNHPILIYQLFYDKESITQRDKFKKLLSDCADKLLDKDKIHFFIVETEVKRLPNFADWKGGNPSEVFSLMKENSQYEFGEITVLDGYPDTYGPHRKR